MKKSDVPVYNDPVDFENGDNKYPCSTQFMTYDPMQHKYFLTAECLTLNGVDVQRRYISDSPNKMQEFIRLVTDTVYDYIQYKAGWKTFQVMLYRIATVPRQIYQDPYTFRKQFEEALIIQAQYIIDNGITTKYSAFDLSKGKSAGVAPEDDYRDNSYISPRTIYKLDFMGLTRWFMLPQFVRLDTDKY